MHRYFIINKPFETLSQFTSAEGKTTLANYFDVPKDVYPVGRLDYDSEGLLILTNDAGLNHRLLHPAFAHRREYWVQVEGNMTIEAINRLQRGVAISIDGRAHHTAPAIARILNPPPAVWPRNPPIRYRKNVPDSWLSLALTEGKNRQVRRMTAAVGFPTLRLIRVAIEKVTVHHLLPGDMQEWQRNDMYKALFGKV